MTHDKQDAILGYVEFNLMAMVERYQQVYAQEYGHDLDGVALGMLYDEAYEVLNELERTLIDTFEDTNDPNIATG